MLLCKAHDCSKSRSEWHCCTLLVERLIVLQHGLGQGKHKTKVVPWRNLEGWVPARTCHRVVPEEIQLVARQTACRVATVLSWGRSGHDGKCNIIASDEPGRIAACRQQFERP